MVSVAGGAFCRRHASTMTAIEGSEVVAGLPDIDNRAPSLVGWVGRELDSRIRELLARVAADSNATLIADPVTMTLTPGGNTRTWAKTWKMVDGSAVRTRITIEVDEGDDCQVGARVDSELIGRGVPLGVSSRRVLSVSLVADRSSRSVRTATPAGPAASSGSIRPAPELSSH